MKRKPLPIGVEDFKRLVDNEYYFVDKTLMIKELLENKETVNLFTRPRRFGKTLNMSMLQRFFEATEKSNAYLFGDLKIAAYPEYMAYFRIQSDFRVGKRNIPKHYGAKSRPKCLPEFYPNLIRHSGKIL